MAEAINRLLTLVQRCKIDAYLSSGRSQRAIALRLGVSPSRSGVHLIPARVDIDQRPAAVATRKSFGHWEGDTIEGAY